MELDRVLRVVQANTIVIQLVTTASAVGLVLALRPLQALLVWVAGLVVGPSVAWVVAHLRVRLMLREAAAIEAAAQLRRGSAPANS